MVGIHVYVNSFLTAQLSTHSLLDESLMSVDKFRIVIAICQLSGSMLCLTVVDFIERKYILLASVTGIMIAQTIYGYFLFHQNETVLPILFIAIAAFSQYFGAYPLTFIIIPEIIPEKVPIFK